MYPRHASYHHFDKLVIHPLFREHFKEIPDIVSSCLYKLQPFLHKHSAINYLTKM